MALATLAQFKGGISIQNTGCRIQDVGAELSWTERRQRCNKLQLFGIIHNALTHLTATITEPSVFSGHIAQRPLLTDNTSASRLLAFWHLFIILKENYFWHTINMHEGLGLGAGMLPPAMHNCSYYVYYVYAVLSWQMLLIENYENGSTP